MCNRQIAVVVLVVSTWIGLSMGCRNPFAPRAPVVFVPEPLLSNPSQITVGYRGFRKAVQCALDDTGVHCWGELAVDSEETTAAWQSAGLSKIDISIADPVSIDYFDDTLCVAGRLQTICQTTAGMVNQALGLPETPYSTTSITTFNNPRLIKVNSILVCALGDSGLECVSRSEINTNLDTLPVFTNPTALDLGVISICGIDSNGVQCWVPPEFIDANPTTYSGLFNIPDNLVNARQVVSVGDRGACALHSLGVQCWGGMYLENFPALNAPTQIAAGISHACALDAEGVKCWGTKWVSDDASGLAGGASTLSNPVTITAGSNSSCAIDDTGIVCW